MYSFKHMLPRAAALVLAVLIVLACASCGKKEDKSDEEVVPTAPAVETDGIKTEHTTPVQTETDVPAVTPEVSAKPESGDAATPSAEPTVSAEPVVSPEPVTPVTPPSESSGGTTTAPVVNSASDIAGNYSVSSANLAQTGDMGQEYIDKIVFLGDSTTYGLRYYAMLNGGKDTMQVWTPTSGTLTLSYQSVATILYPETNTEITIREAAALKKPEYLVITLGVNGVSFMDEAYFKSEYTDLVRGIQTASPDTKIILQSIFPVASDYQYISSINNVKIAAANQWVIDIAEETGVKYLATASALIGDDGFLPHGYQNGDGLHLNTDSFTVVLDYIRTHGWQ